MSGSCLPKIVTSSLVLCLDAANTKSLVSASTWKDLSRSNIVGTLNNGGTGLTFSSTSGGCISFDGVNDYVSFNTLPSMPSFTIEAWFNLAGPGSVGSTTYGTICGISNSNRLLINAGNGTLLAQMGAGNHFSTARIVLNTWSCVHYVYDGATTTAQWFVNSAPDSTLSGSISFSTTTRIGTTDLANYMFMGSMAKYALYSRALTAAEVTQNYRTLISRFF